MKRRQFLKAGGALIAASMTSRAAVPHATAPLPRILPLSHNWRFKAADAGATGDDAGFTAVTLPHSNVSLPWHNFDDHLYEFVSTYRRTFRLPAEARGKRVFVDFEGAMTSSTVFLNGQRLGQYLGGYTPFSFELTQHLRFDAPNTLAVRLDSTEQANVPPFGHEVDYLTFGGIYREVSLRIVPQLFLDNVHARTLDVLSAAPVLEADVFLSQPVAEDDWSVRVDLLDGERIVASQAMPLPAGRKAAAFSPAPGNVYQQPGTMDDPARYTVRLDKLRGIELWQQRSPKLYQMRATLLRAGSTVDEQTARVGFREARFTPEGFYLNGKHLKLRGLDRHQMFPFAGQAMAARAQRKDADILRYDLHCNIVRTSHYPQSRHFLDRCDEIGLLVLEEITGWQHIGDVSWQDIAVDNVRRMLQRDWNRPSIILWGVRINESKDDDAFYTRTNALAHEIDTTRQTGGIRNKMYSHLLEDVFTINDFGFPLQAPNHPLYLNTEFVGHTYPTKQTDDDERQRELTLRHARIHNQLAGDARYAGGIGWCAFDYNTHSNFGSGDRMCYHGVTDIFRIPKPAAGFYKSQCDPDEEVVLEPAFHWALSDESTKFSVALICSNCERLELYFHPHGEPEGSWHRVAALTPDRKSFPNLRYAPFQVDIKSLGLDKLSFPWGDLRIDGYLGSKLAITRTLSGDGFDHQFHAVADSTELLADGADVTRVVLRVTDQFGNQRTYADDPIVFQLQGPAELIGDNPFSLIGGVGAVWLRAAHTAGTAILTAKHPRLGAQTVRINLSSTPRPVLL